MLKGYGEWVRLAYQVQHITAGRFPCAEAGWPGGSGVVRSGYFGSPFFATAVIAEANWSSSFSVV